MSNVKFHKRATVIYVAKQKAKGQRVTVPLTDTVGTITVANATVTGVGTVFTTQATEGAYLYDANGYEVGRILSIDSDTSITLTSNILATSTLATPTSTRKAGLSAGTGVNTGALAFDGSAYSFGLGNAHAVRVQEGMSFTFQTETGAVTYVGNELDRYEQTWIKDEYVEASFSSFVPVLGLLANPNQVAMTEIPLPDLFEGCGLGVVLGTTSVDYTSSVPSEDYLEIEFRLASPALTTNDPYYSEEKVYHAYDMLGFVDFEIANLGERAVYKYSFKGDTGDVTMEERRIPDYGSQSLEIAEPFSSTSVIDSIKLVALELIFEQKTVTFGATGNTVFIDNNETISLAGLVFRASTDGVTVRNMVDIYKGLPEGITAAQANILKAADLLDKGTFTTGVLTGVTTKGIGSLTTILVSATSKDTNMAAMALTGTAVGGPDVVWTLVDSYAYRTKPTTSNLCIGKFLATNVTGRDLQRFQLSCEAGFYPGLVPTDISISVKEDVEGIFFQPNKHIGVEGILWLEWGDATRNSLVTIQFSKVCISKVTPSEIANFRAFDVTLRNLEYFTMTLA